VSIKSNTGRPTEIDPITFEVLHNALISLVDEMGVLVNTVAFSLVVSEGHDFSGSLCNVNGDLVTTGKEDQPAHVGTVPFMIRSFPAWFEGDPAEVFEPGDVIVSNDAYLGCTHNNDMRFLMPVFYEDELVGYTQGTAHWPDVGGHVPGTFDPQARSSHAEGLIVPPIKIVRAGELDRQVVKLIMRNIRDAETAYGDLIAQIGACRLGAERLTSLMDTYGASLVLAEMDAVIAYSEAHLREHFKQLPDGTWNWTAWVDRDPGEDSDERLPVRLTLTINGDHATYDFSGSAPLAKGAINASRAVTVSASWCGTKVVFPDVPLNQGILRAVDFEIPERSMLDAPYPAPISGMAASVYTAVTDCILGCYMQIAPERCMAGPVGLINTVMGGFDPRPGYGREYVSYLWQEGGWGARVAKKDNHSAMPPFGAGARNQPIEQYERFYPIRFNTYRFEPDSAGAGCHRGGLGTTKEWLVTDGSAVISNFGDGEKEGPWGWDGGRSGRADHLIYAPGTDEEKSLGMFVAGYPVEPGRAIQSFRAGGGGYGDPYTRRADWVLEDVLDGFVTITGAERDYGVVIEVIDLDAGDLRVDEAATRARRAR
jgi:N-methylhydantoinase B